MVKEQLRNQEEQIVWLNSMVKVRIAPSKIHGVGIVALFDIPKGTKLYLDNMPEVFNVPYSSFGKLFPKVKELLLERWPQIVNGSAFIYPDARYLAYCNHSKNPNYDAKNDETLRDIKAGEEIVEDYRLIDNYQKVFDWIK